MSLKTNELVDYMLAALGDEYRIMKNRDLPSAFSEDRELLFRAIARGILEYLEAKQGEFISTIQFTGEDERQVDNVDLNITP